jgi:hypothetical protein
MRAASRAVTYFFLATFSQLAEIVFNSGEFVLISKISKKTFFEEKSPYFSIG